MRFQMGEKVHIVRLHRGNNSIGISEDHFGLAYEWTVEGVDVHNPQGHLYRLRNTQLGSWNAYDDMLDPANLMDQYPDGERFRIVCSMGSAWYVSFPKGQVVKPMDVLERVRPDSNSVEVGGSASAFSGYIRGIGEVSVRNVTEGAR